MIVDSFYSSYRAPREDGTELVYVYVYMYECMTSSIAQIKSNL